MCPEYAKLEISSTNSLRSVIEELLPDDVEKINYVMLKEELKNQGIFFSDSDSEFYLRVKLLIHLKEGDVNMDFTPKFKRFLTMVLMQRKELARLRFISHAYKNPNILLPSINIYIDDLSQEDFEPELDKIIGPRRKKESKSTLDKTGLFPSIKI